MGAEYENRCNKSMVIAKLIDKLDRRPERGEKTEEAWQEVRKTARKLEAWIEEIAEQKGDFEYEHINKQIRSERDIAEKIEMTTEAWNQLKKCEDEEYKKILRKRYNNCKNVLNKARKKLRRIHKREVVREIEKLSTRYPGEYWRLLKQLTGRKKKKRKTIKTMIDEEGYEVEGAERGEKTVEAWQEVKKAARKLEVWIEEITEQKRDFEYEHINKQIRSERDIAEKIEMKTEAWNQLKKCEDEEYKKILRKRYNNCKNVLNKARKKLRRKHKREVVREREKLSTRYPEEYWRLLKQLTGKKKKKTKPMK